MKNLMFITLCLLFLFVTNNSIKANSCTDPVIVNICPEETLFNEDLGAPEITDNALFWNGPDGTIVQFDTEIFYEVVITQDPNAAMPPSNIQLTIANISSGSLYVFFMGTSCGADYLESHIFDSSDCQRTEGFDISQTGAGTYYFAVGGVAGTPTYDIHFSGTTGTSISPGTTGCDLGFWDFEDVSSCGLTPFKSTVPYFELSLNGSVLGTNSLLTYNLGSPNQLCIKSNFQNITGGESVKIIDFNFGPALTATPITPSNNPIPPYGSIPAQQAASGRWQVSSFTNPTSDPAYIPTDADVTNRISWFFDAQNQRGDAMGCDYNCGTYEFCFEISSTNNNPQDTKIVGVFYPDNYSTPSVSQGTVINHGCNSNLCLCDPATCFANNPPNNNSPKVIDFEDPAPLPVELLYFKGKNDNGNNQLSWRTASELNNSHFELEYSTEDHKFEKIATIFGNGTTSKSTDYSYLHQQVSRGTHYYRLKQVDFDNAYEYSDIISVNHAFNESLVQLNYAINSNIIEFHFEEFENNDRPNIELYNLSGQLVHHVNSSSNNLIPIDISNFSNGHYFAKIQYNGKIITKRFVKAR